MSRYLAGFLQSVAFPLKLRRPTSSFLRNLLILGALDKMDYVILSLSLRIYGSRTVSPHRHTFAVTAMQKGISLPALQRLLGHDTLLTTGSRMTRLDPTEFTFSKILRASGIEPGSPESVLLADLDDLNLGDVPTAVFIAAVAEVLHDEQEHKFMDRGWMLKQSAVMIAEQMLLRAREPQRAGGHGTFRWRVWRSSASFRQTTYRERAESRAKSTDEALDGRRQADTRSSPTRPTVSSVPVSKIAAQRVPRMVSGD